MTSVFDRPKETLSWGNKAIQEFQDIVVNYFAGDPYKEIKEIDPETRDEVVKQIPVTQFPHKEVERKVTEAMLHIKYTFDQVSHAACVSTDPFLAKHTTNFPWTDSLSGLEKRLSKGKFPKALWPAFHSLEPYAAGDTVSDDNKIARELAKIVNRKHTVGIALNPTVNGVEMRLHGTVRNLTILNPRWNPVTDEIEIRRGAPQPDLNHHYSLRIDVVFDKSTSLKGVPVLPCLRIFAAKAEKAIQVLSSIDYDALAHE